MFCDGCGTAVPDTAGFCPVCGKALARMLPADGRLAGHVRRLGILWLAISAFRMLPGLTLLSWLGPGPHFLPFRTVGGVFLGAAVLGLIAGWGLLERQPWARLLAIVLACFSLFEVPFGTALGIYTLCILAPSRSEEEYRVLASG
jgi:hypothetical protein